MICTTRLLLPLNYFVLHLPSDDTVSENNQKPEPSAQTAARRKVKAVRDKCTPGDPEHLADSNTVVVCMPIYGESDNPLARESSGSSSNSSWIQTALCAPTNKHSTIKTGYHQSFTPNNIILDAHSRLWI